MNIENLPFYWSTIFVRRLFESGVRHAVISPGSRSTPLTLAFAAHPGISKHVVLDERSAAFTALGIGKSSGIPPVLVCTSGTAVANYFPAVIEAAQSHTPIIILSADRPASLMQIGASQTINQSNIYGDYTVFHYSLGEPVDGERELARVRKAAEQAVYFATQKKGVSHLNFPFKKPFEPTKKFYNSLKKENEELFSLFMEHAPIVEKTRTTLNEYTLSDLVSAEKPIIIVGPRTSSASSESILKLAECLKAPIIAENGSQLPLHDHIISGADGFIRHENNVKELKPDLIIRFGNQPVSKGIFSFLRSNSDIPQINFFENDLWSDEPLTSSSLIPLKGNLEIRGVSGAAPKKWLRSWLKAQKKFSSIRKSALEKSSTLTDGYVFNKIGSLLEEDMYVMLSNSFPVRDMNLFHSYHSNSFVNRGAAGIDGITSTAIGIGIHQQKKGVLLTGDLAFIHDSNALRSVSELKFPLTIVVLNNGGGTIFKTLPIHQLKNVYENYFETPQHVSFTHLCRAHGVQHTLVTKKEQLVDAFRKASSSQKVTVIECITDADRSMKERIELWNTELSL